MGPNRNIELKARCADLNRAKTICLAMGAHEAGFLLQTDTYFHVTHGRLKLREIASDRAELIWYARPNEPGTRRSDYVLVPIPDPAALKTALSAALGVRSLVRKRRELLQWHNVRIHLDEVEGLGKFIEFEAVMMPDESEAVALERLKELSARLGITDADRIAESYGELIIERS